MRVDEVYLYDTLECRVCKQRATITNRSVGTMSCCGEAMANVTYERVRGFVNKTLSDKLKLIATLRFLDGQLTQHHRWVHYHSAIDSIIERETGRMNQLIIEGIESSQSEPNVTKQMMEIIDDLYLSSLNLYPWYASMASRESNNLAQKLFLAAGVSDKENIKVLESILYSIEDIEVEEQSD
nr:hypothetical protein BCU58_24205 [Vibrio sp. 10N.286.48.B7]